MKFIVGAGRIWIFVLVVLYHNNVDNYHDYYTADYEDKNYYHEYVEIWGDVIWFLECGESGLKWCVAGWILIETVISDIRKIVCYMFICWIEKIAF